MVGSKLMHTGHGPLHAVDRTSGLLLFTAPRSSIRGIVSADEARLVSVDRGAVVEVDLCSGESRHTPIEVPDFDWFMTFFVPTAILASRDIIERTTTSGLSFKKMDGTWHVIHKSPHQRSTVACGDG